jgi:large conductance mechanosensitive channel
MNSNNEEKSRPGKLKYFAKSGGTKMKQMGIKTRKHGVGFFQDFKTFVVRGNVIDLAVALVVGAAFTAIVQSFVNDLVTPLIGLALAHVNLENLFHILKQGKSPCTTPNCYGTVELAAQDGAVTLNYGKFIQVIFNFLITSFFMFVVVKLMQNLRKTKDIAPEERECPFCFSKIKSKSTRCAFCTSAVIPEFEEDSL